MVLLPVGAGYIEAQLGARGHGSDWLGYARAEAGWRPLKPLALFGFAEATTASGWAAGLGARLSW